jgi:hypothetical protein
VPELDADRLNVADTLRRALAIENELSRPQARAYVRCLQTTWHVPTIQWSERESARQLADARRLLHAAHIFREIEGTSSPRAIDCYRRTGEILEWLSRAADGIRAVVPIELLAAAAYQLGGLPAMASGLLRQVETDHRGVALYSAFLRADFDGVIHRSVAFWNTHPDLTTPDAALRLATAGVEEFDLEEDDNRIAWFFTVELVRSLGLIADSLRRGDDVRLEIAMSKLHALDEMATRTFSDDASLVIALMRQVADGYRAASIYRPLRIRRNTTHSSIAFSMSTVLSFVVGQASGMTRCEQHCCVSPAGVILRSGACEAGQEAGRKPSSVNVRRWSFRLPKDDFSDRRPWGRMLDSREAGQVAQAA